MYYFSIIPQHVVDLKNGVEDNKNMNSMSYMKSLTDNFINL